MNKKEAIVFIGKHYGVMPIEQLSAAVGMKMATVSQYAWRLRKQGIAVVRYAAIPTTNDFRDAVAELTLSN